MGKCRNNAHAGRSSEIKKTCHEDRRDLLHEELRERSAYRIEYSRIYCISDCFVIIYVSTIS